MCIRDRINPSQNGIRAVGYLDDDEDSGGHSLQSTLDSTLNRLNAVEGNLTYRDELRDRDYAVVDGKLPFFMHRERGLHLDEPEVLIDKRPVCAAILGTALTLYYAGQAQIRNNQCVYFYLPKLESASESKFYRDFFDAKLGSEDDDFFVIVDGDELQFEETKDESHRSISFLVDPGSEEIEIIGSVIAGVSYILEKEAEVQAEIEAEEIAIEQEKAEKVAEVVAILEEQCGEGTILEDGVCVLENPVIESPPIDSSPLIYGMFGAMGIGLTVVLILWGIGKRSNKEIPPEQN